MDISFHPPPDPNDRRNARAIVPFHRRVFAWFADYQKFVVTFVGIHGAALGAHAYLKGLITRRELDVAVEAAVSKATKDALLEMRGDLDIIKTNTGGLKEWRGETSGKVIALERDIAKATYDANKANERIDSYLVTVRVHR